MPAARLPKTSPDRYMDFLQKVHVLVLGISKATVYADDTTSWDCGLARAQVRTRPATSRTSRQTRRTLPAGHRGVRAHLAPG